MNKIDAIVVHCSATRAGQDIGKKEINQMHVARGFQCIGYNYVVRLDGTVEVGRSLTIDGAHCNSKGFSGVSYNKHSIGICYIGGLDAHGKAADTRTPEQKEAIAKLIKELCVGSALGALPHFCGRFPRACPRTVLTCLHVHGSPL